jgi:hypothetical protein
MWLVAVVGRCVVGCEQCSNAAEFKQNLSYTLTCFPDTNFVGFKYQILLRVLVYFDFSE